MPTATLPGMEDEKRELLISAAENYVQSRDTRMSELKKEIELKECLILLMRENNLTTFRDDESNLTITLETQTRVKVKSGSDSED